MHVVFRADQIGHFPFRVIAGTGDKHGAPAALGQSPIHRDSVNGWSPISQTSKNPDHSVIIHISPPKRLVPPTILHG